MADLIDILDSKGITYRKTNNSDEILLSCTAGTHEDKNPSLCINMEKQIFHCWSCGFKGKLKQFLKSIGIRTELEVTSKQENKIKKLKLKLDKMIRVEQIEIPKDIRGIHLDFKGINVPTLKEFEAFFTESYGLNDYLCIPVYQYDKLRFIEARYRFGIKEGIPKYQRKPYGANVSDILFPLDKFKGYSNVILVEGIFDMLNLWQLGFTNTLCIFGTNNFSQKKIELLDRLNVTSAQVLLDGDKAGQVASEKIYALLEKNNIAAKICKLPDGKDPGELTLSEAKFYLQSS